MFICVKTFHAINHLANRIDERVNFESPIENTLSLMTYIAKGKCLFSIPAPLQKTHLLLETIYLSWFAVVPQFINDSHTPKCLPSNSSGPVRAVIWYQENIWECRNLVNILTSDSIVTFKSGAFLNSLFKRVSVFLPANQTTTKSVSVSPI